MKHKNDVFRVYTRLSELNNILFPAFIIVCACWAFAALLRENFVIPSALPSERTEIIAVYVARFGILVVGLPTVSFSLLRETAFRLYGQPLDGEITYISGAWEKVWFPGPGGPNSHYLITVRYQFIEPKNGEILSREVQSKRGDLSEQPLPEVGTQLVILYLNKYFYRVL